MDTKIKQRLIGTGVLIALAVIFIPMLFESARVPQTEPTSFESDIATPTPAVADAGQAVSETSQSGSTANNTATTDQRPTDISAAAGDNSANVDGTSAATAIDAKPAATVQQATQTTVNPSNPTIVGTQSKLDNATSLAISGNSASQHGNKGWAIQLASFESEKHAESLVNTLKQQGFSAFTATAKIGNQARVRVYVGPESDPQQAKLTLSKLQQTLHMQGFLVSITPEIQPQTT